MLKQVLAVALLLVPIAAFAAPPLVNPVTVNPGSPVHLTPIDQNSTPIPVGQCSLTGVLATLATWARDATGIVITAVAPGTAVVARIACTDGYTTVNSPAFTLTVPNPPYAVSAVGSTSP